MIENDETVDVTIQDETIRGKIIENNTNDGYVTYKVDLIGFDEHRNDEGELWVNEFEITKVQ